VTAPAAAASLAVLVLLASACQSSGSRATAAIAGTGPSGRSSAAREASGSPLPEGSAGAVIPSPPPPGPSSTAHLTIAGSTTSTVESTRSRGTCGAGPAGYAAALTFPLAGQPYVLSMELADYHGPGRYSVPPERVSLHTDTGTADPRLLAAVSGSVTINPDQGSGSIDTTLSDRSRVTGTWACGS